MAGAGPGATPGRRSISSGPSPAVHVPAELALTVNAPDAAPPDEETTA